MQGKNPLEMFKRLRRVDVASFYKTYFNMKKSYSYDDDDSWSG